MASYYNLALLEYSNGLISTCELLKKPISINLFRDLIEKYEGISEFINPEGCINTKKKKGILIIDDDSFSILIMKTTFQKSSYRLFIASNGLEGLNIFYENYEEIGLIITDCNMPVFDGYETGKEIAKFCQKLGKNKTPIIAISGYNDDNHKYLCKEAGFEEVLLKPLKENEILDYAKYYLS